MKQMVVAIGAMAFGAGGAMAGKLDRSGTPVDIIFQDGNYAELSLGYANPNIGGADLLGNAVGNVGGDFTVLGGGVKLDFGGRFAFALIMDEPYGSDIQWNGNALTTLLGGTFADADSIGLTGLLKYQATDRIAIYGGIRAVRAEGRVGLRGLAYGALNGYKVNFDSDYGAGAVLGAAYEIPDIAFRATLTYHSSVDLHMNTTEAFPVAPGVTGPFVPTGKTNVELPQSVKLELQSGIARDTLVFGSVRWSEWEAFSLDPPSPAPNLAEIDDDFTYEVGIGRRFTDKLSASVGYIFEAEGDDDLVSPLAPVNGQQAVAFRAKYAINDRFDISAGLRYAWLGDAMPETGTPDTPRAQFRDNDAVALGVKLGVHF